MLEETEGDILPSIISPTKVMNPPIPARGTSRKAIVLLTETNVEEAVEAQGYTGPVEIEIFNEALWAMPPDEALKLIRQRWLERV